MPSSRPEQNPAVIDDLHPSLREPATALQQAKDTALDDPRRSRQWAHHALTTLAEVVLATNDKRVIDQGATIRHEAQQLHTAADEALRPGADADARRRADRFLHHVNAFVAAEAARYTNRGAATRHPSEPVHEHEADSGQRAPHRAPERNRPSLGH